jgi:capsular exopolysaccharide synthesis family protein
LVKSLFASSLKEQILGIHQAMENNINSLVRVSNDPEDHRPANGHGNGNGYHRYWGIDNADENLFKEYLRSIRKHLWLVIGLTLVVTSLVAIYEISQPDIYAAHARVQVDLENNPGTDAGKNGTIVINSLTTDPTYFNTQLQNLSSQGLLRRVVKTLDLEHNQDFLRPAEEQRSFWQNLLHIVGRDEKAPGKPPENQLRLKQLAPATSRDDLEEAQRLEPYVSRLRTNLKVDPVKETRVASFMRDTRLIDVTLSEANPQIAAKIVNAIVDSFVLSNLEKKTETSANASDFLQKRVAELQSQIREGEERLVNYAKDHEILSLDGNQNTVVERLVGLNSQLMQAENDRKQAEAALRAARAPGAAAALTAKGDKDELETKLAALRQKRTELLVENTEQWPEVKETDQQIAIVEKQINESHEKASTTLLTNLETQYQQALGREKSIREAFDKQRGETLTQNQSAINYRIIQQEVETNKQLLDGLLQRSRENDVVLAGTPNNISVVDYALAPQGPIGPERLRSIVIALFLGLAGSIGLAIFLEYMNDSVRSTDDVDKWLRLPAIGVIPAIGSGSKRRKLLPGFNGNGNVQPELLLDVKKRSALAESYRHLRTSVLLSSAGHAPKTLLVTSSMAAEGKTTTAVNAALSLAQTGAKVLVIDADMRRPRLHSIFDLKNKDGLSTILSSEFNQEELVNVIVAHESGLHIITSGPLPPNPAELVGSDQMRHLLTVLQPQFNQIVIDSPPICSFTDGVLAATMVDGVLLVVQSGKTSRTVVRRALQVLQDVGAKIFGVVLNRTNLRDHDYYYYGDYQSRYYEKDEEVEIAS